MARPRSEDKRLAILKAAAALIAQQGLSATPTSDITKRAKVAEGTLFTYFKTKDELINALYRHIKSELAAVLMSDFPSDANERDRMEHVWNQFVQWGVANPQSRRVLQQVEGSNRLTRESKTFGEAPFEEIDQTAKAAIARKVLRDMPRTFMSDIFQSQAEVTINHVTAHPRQAAKYRKLGFDALWNGIGLR